MIETPRLLLRPWRKTDLDAMAAINANPSVMQYFPATQDLDQTKGFLGRQHFHQQEHGYCYFAAELRATNQVIGFIGMNHQDYAAPFAPATDIGWRLAPEFWRKGLATEGARACLTYAWETLGLPEVVAVAIEQNLPSIGVMQKIGMANGGTFDHPGLSAFPEIQRCVWYHVAHPDGNG
ncbi:MAG: GNAT family N-acetyltransferase [Bacteroidota bacterium]